MVFLGTLAGILAWTLCAVMLFWLALCLYKGWSER